MIVSGVALFILLATFRVLVMLDIMTAEQSIESGIKFGLLDVLLVIIALVVFRSKNTH